MNTITFLILKIVNFYLPLLRTNEDRKQFIEDIDSVCHLCGQTVLPCLCAPGYDE